MDKEIRSHAGDSRSGGVRSLGRLVLLGYYNSYPSSRIHHFCTSQWYLLILQQLRQMGYLDEAEAWFVSDRELEFVQHDVRVRCFRSFDAMARASESADILWVRGKCRAYLEVLRRMSATLRVYYPASKRFLSRDWPHFDVVLVDDLRQLEPVRRLGAAPIVEKVLKTADPEIFQPLVGINKQYDLCMIGGMQLTRKNYRALVHLLQSDPSFTAVVIGKQQAETVHRLGATGARVQYIEFCGRDELNRVMNQSRIGFVPSLMDAAPRVILEYMSAGVPVLLNSAILGGRDYITAETGLLAAESEFLAAARRLRQTSGSLPVRTGFERQFAPRIAAEHLGSILAGAAERLGRTRPTSQPGWMQRIANRPLWLRRRLAQCWRDINCSY